MLVTKKSPITGKTTTLDLAVTDDQLRRWMDGELIQRAMPQLTADEREFLITGMAPGEFDKLFPDD